MKKSLIISALALAAASAMPAAQAQFANVDPVQAGHAIQQIQQAAQLYSTTQQATQNVINNYNLAKEMASSPSMLYSTFQSRSQQWVGVTPSANTYGNTTGWINAVTNREPGCTSAINRSAYRAPASSLAMASSVQKGSGVLRRREPAPILATRQIRPPSRPSAPFAPTRSSGSRTSPTWRR